MTFARPHESDARAKVEPACAALYEIKKRLLWARETFIRVEKSQEATDLRFEHDIDQDNIYVQVRLVCELTAIAVAYVQSIEDSSILGVLRDKWHPKIIYSLVERINPTCFPQNGFVREHMGQIIFTPMPRFFDKADLLSVYGKCGDRLHVGGVSKFEVRREVLLDTDLGGIINSLWQLLIYNVITAPSGDIALFCSLLPVEHDGIIYEVAPRAHFY